jgi:hypothetical protein
MVSKIVSKVFVALGNIVEDKGCIYLSEIEEGNLRLKNQSNQKE